MTSAAFDTIADQYDTLWTASAIGRAQREAVWRWMDPLFAPGDRILDLGCGTGADAVHFAKCGVSVHGIDGSAEMVRVAQRKGIEAQHLALEDLHQLSGRYDGAISNFGALNCVEGLERVAGHLRRLIRFHGLLVVCLIGRFCFWETCHYLRSRDFRAACRRFGRTNVSSSLGVCVRYPSVRAITAAFKGFNLLSWYGIGLFVPPSYVKSVSAVNIKRMAKLDHQLAHIRGLRMLCDHRLLVFERL